MPEWEAWGSPSMKEEGDEGKWKRASPSPPLSALNSALPEPLPPQGSTLHRAFGPPEPRILLGSASEVSLTTAFWSLKCKVVCLRRNQGSPVEEKAGWCQDWTL